MRWYRMARWAAAGLPGLWSACRRSGLTRAEAREVLQGSWQAIVVSRRRFAGRPHEQNAVRHFVWQAWLTGRYGVPVAEALGAQHERVSLDPVDSQVDAANNRVAQEYGADHAERIAGAPTARAQARLAETGARLWREGGLFTAVDGEVRPSQPGR